VLGQFLLFCFYYFVRLACALGDDWDRVCVAISLCAGLSWFYNSVPNPETKSSYNQIGHSFLTNPSFVVIFHVCCTTLFIHLYQASSVLTYTYMLLQWFIWCFFSRWAAIEAAGGAVEELSALLLPRRLAARSQTWEPSSLSRGSKVMAGADAASAPSGFIYPLNLVNYAPWSSCSTS
jgi:hypothetical protein